MSSRNVFDNLVNVPYVPPVDPAPVPLNPTNSTFDRVLYRMFRDDFPETPMEPKKLPLAAKENVVPKNTINLDSPKKNTEMIMLTDTPMLTIIAPSPAVAAKKSTFGGFKSQMVATAHRITNRRFDHSLDTDNIPTIVIHPLVMTEEDDLALKAAIYKNRPVANQDRTRLRALIPEEYLSPRMPKVDNSPAAIRYRRALAKGTARTAAAQKRAAATTTAPKRAPHTVVVVSTKPPAPAQTRGPLLLIPKNKKATSRSSRQKENVVVTVKGAYGTKYPAYF
jgi:hypothetical protein